MRMTLTAHKQTLIVNALHEKSEGDHKAAAALAGNHVMLATALTEQAAECEALAAEIERLAYF